MENKGKEKKMTKGKRNEEERCSPEIPPRPTVITGS
jgi:hypothetical protein